LLHIQLYDCRVMHMHSSRCPASLLPSPPPAPRTPCLALRSSRRYAGMLVCWFIPTCMLCARLDPSGRVPKTKGLGLEEVGVKLGKKGEVRPRPGKGRRRRRKKKKKEEEERRRRKKKKKEEEEEERRGAAAAWAGTGGRWRPGGAQRHARMS
jgi:hypothetical protein